MADYFQGSDSITIQPGDTSLPYRFKVTVASSSELHNGALPHGSTVISCTVGADRSESGTTAGTLVQSSTEDGNTVIARLTYSTGLSFGQHKLVFRVTASVNGSTATPLRRDFDFDRVWVKNR